MSETPQDSNPVLHDWLSSTVIFRTFRMAVQPGKILLALGGLLLTCLVGVCMDAIWAASGAEVYSGEVMQYVTRPHFSTWKERRREADTEMLAGILVAHKAADDVAAARKSLQDDRAGAMSRLRTKLQSEFEPLMDLDARLSAEEERIGELPEGEREKAREALVNLPEAVAQSRGKYLALQTELGNLGNQGVFSEWMAHNLHFARAALNSLLRLNLADRPASGGASSNPINPFSPDSFLGALGCIAGTSIWMAREHTFYAVIFLILNLGTWSFFGAGICRMAALQATRDEKISMGHAVRFACEKWRDFLLTPIIPVIFLFVLGLGLFVGGMITAIPVLGEIVGTLLFPAALLGGFVIALVIVGFFGGLGMMWPTIGVEGSDSFDAISRSFSYVYNKPWRTIVLVLAMLIYGSLCYLFMRFFLWLVLIGTHIPISLGAGVWADRPDAGAEMNKFSVMWEAPTFGDLRPQFEMVHLSGAEPFGAVVMWGCVSLAVLTLRAFVISFLLTGFTWVYLLLRREVDATDLEDVYLDEEGLDGDDGGEPPVPETPAPAPKKGKSLPVVNAPPTPEPEKGAEESGDSSENP